jgi:hypothetical protein
VLTALFIKAMNDVGRQDLWNVGKFIWDCKAQQPIRQPYEYLHSLLLEPEISSQYQIKFKIFSSFANETFLRDGKVCIHGMHFAQRIHTMNVS